jgi:catechol 2,3-dioxygenase-like lactoylglutathione lyase family enzyme
MINGAHVVIYSRDAEADRAFFCEVLQLAFVDAGHGWLIFGLPVAESAVGRHELYLMCDNLKAEMERLRAEGGRVHGSSGSSLGLNH